MNSSQSNSQDEPTEITTIAILDDETGKWNYITFDTREQARQAVNEARSQGKAAVFYSNEQSIPPES